MSVTWGNLESHQTAWERAKLEKGITDVRDLNSEQFRSLIARATELQKEESYEASL